MRKIIIIFLAMLVWSFFVPIVQPQIKPTPRSTGNIEFPTKTWDIESSTYLSQFLVWDFDHLGNNLWRFSFEHWEYLPIENRDPVPNPIRSLKQATELSKFDETWNSVKDLPGFKDSKTFLDDIKKIDKYPVEVIEGKEYVSRVPESFSILEEQGSFTIQLKEWKNGIKIKVGFGTAIIFSQTDMEITVTGYTEGTPCTFDDIYQADKSGHSALHNRTGISSADGSPVAVDYVLRPSDERVLGGLANDLYINITNWSGPSSVAINVAGTNEAGSPHTDGIIAFGNGQFFLTDLFETVTATQVFVFTGVGSFDYILWQDQWGIIGRLGDYGSSLDTSYFFDADLTIGDGTTDTWFGDSGVSVTFGDANEVVIEDNATMRLGELVDAGNFTTKNGCAIFMDFDSITEKFRIDGSLLGYSTSWHNTDRDKGLFYLSPLEESVFRMWNCHVSSYAYVYQFGEWNMTEFNWYRSIIENNQRGLSLTTGTFPNNHFTDTVIKGCEYGVRSTWLGYYGNENITLRNVWLANSELHDWDFYNWGTQGYTADFYAIDPISDWTFNWGSCNDTNSRFHRQYTMNVHVIDQDGADVSSARVMVWDLNDTLVFDELTDVNGVIDEQVVEYAYYHPDGDDTPVVYSPHTMKINKTGYDDIETEWTMDEPVDWLLTLIDPNYPDDEYSYASNYPMEWTGSVLRIWGENGSGTYDVMGSNWSNAITMEEVFEFSAYTMGEGICTKDSDNSYTMKRPLVIGDGVNATYFVSRNENVYQYDYYTIRNNANFMMGSNETDASNPYADPKFGSRWILDRVTSFSGGGRAYFIQTGGKHWVYDSQIYIVQGGRSYDSQANSFTYFHYSSIGGYTRTDPTYIRFWGELYFDHWTVHHVRNLNFPNPPMQNSTGLVVYSNQNNLQVRDFESWIYDPQLFHGVDFDLKVLAAGKANIVDPIGFNRNNIDVQVITSWVKAWHRFARNILNSTGDPIENARVRVWNNDGTLVYDELTNSSGWTDVDLIQNWVTTSVGEPPTFYDYGPFNVTVTHNDYATDSQTIYEIDRKMNDWVMVMYNISGEIAGLGLGPEDLAGGLLIAFIVIPFLIILIWRVKKR